MLIYALYEEVIGFVIWALGIEGGHPQSLEVFEQEQTNHWSNQRDDQEDSFDPGYLQCSETFDFALTLKLHEAIVG